MGRVMLFPTCPRSPSLSCRALASTYTSPPAVRSSGKDIRENELHQNRAAQFLACRYMITNQESVFSRHLENTGLGSKGIGSSCQCMCEEQSFLLNKYPYLHIPSGCGGGGRREGKEEGGHLPPKPPRAWTINSSSWKLTADSSSKVSIPRTSSPRWGPGVLPH